MTTSTAWPRCGSNATTCSARSAGCSKAPSPSIAKGKTTPDAFARFFAPRLRFFLGQLEGHHAIEDEHYFPLFAKAESRLARGFDILDGDHHVIHDALERNADAANAFLRALQEDADRQRFAADAYADENARLVAMLRRHLADEEDLIIPLILERGIGM